MGTGLGFMIKPGFNANLDFYWFSVKIDEFEKKNVRFAMKLGIWLDIQNLQEFE